MEDTEPNQRLEAGHDLEDWLTWHYGILTGVAHVFSNVLINDLKAGGDARRARRPKRAQGIVDFPEDITDEERLRLRRQNAVRGIEEWINQNHELTTQCEDLLARLILKDMSKEVDS